MNGRRRGRGPRAGRGGSDRLEVGDDADGEARRDSDAWKSDETGCGGMGEVLGSSGV